MSTAAVCAVDTSAGQWPGLSKHGCVATLAARVVPEGREITATAGTPDIHLVDISSGIGDHDVGGGYAMLTPHNVGSC